MTIRQFPSDSDSYQPWLPPRQSAFAIDGYPVIGNGSRRKLVFALGKQTEKFCQAQFVCLAHGTLAIRLNPFGMFPEQGFVHLLLKLNVSLNVVRNRLRRFRVHVE